MYPVLGLQGYGYIESYIGYAYSRSTYAYIE